MELVILGAHQLESSETRCTTLLIDGRLALDASSLSSTLSFTDQARLRAVLVTHYHYDHVKELPTVGFNLGLRGKSIVVGCSAAVREALLTHFFNGQIWLRLHQFPSPEQPALRFLTTEPGQWLTVEGYRVLPISMPHSVPVTGYQIVAPDGASLFYSSDTGPGWVNAALPHLLPDLRLLVTEVTMSNDLEDVALRAGHLTPRLLGVELSRYRERRGHVPPVVIVHVNPGYAEAIHAELAALTQELGLEITVGREGMHLTV